ncbi:MAG: GNAT family N-acetyltransferase [Candidatus Lokiarchaeota archaeon]|nr:GNAT family N-acetyltransferase [Candidatus Lokiarchaeota archaeon]
MLKKGYRKKIGDNLILRIAEENEEEIDRIIKLNIQVHGEDLKNYMYRLFRDHPNRKDHIWFYIENEENDRIISSGVLFPEMWDFEGINIPICEMGFVATAEDSRDQGLFSMINRCYEKVMRERGYLLSVIRGVPFFYRRYGYEFAIPLDYGYKISYKNIPESENYDIRIRRALEADIDNLKNLYNQWAEKYSITQKFNTKSFIYKYLNDKYTEFQFRTYVLEEEKEVQAFFCVGGYFGTEHVIMQTSAMTCRQILRMLDFWKNECKKQNNLKENAILILNPPNSELTKFVLSLGAKRENKWRWQIKIPNLKKFFDAIRPLMERRITNSIFQDVDKILKMSNYRENVHICFRNGGIKQIELRKGFPEEPDYDLKVPNSHLTQIILGSKKIQEIESIITDTIYREDWLLFMEKLFPKQDSYCCSYF